MAFVGNGMENDRKRIRFLLFGTNIKIEGHLFQFNIFTKAQRNSLLIKHDSNLTQTARPGQAMATPAHGLVFKITRFRLS